jgi:hypothetical protein
MTIQRIEAAGLDVAAMRRAMGREGCFVLTGVFDPAGIARIRERADFLARAWDYMIAQGYTAPIKDYLESGAFRAGHLPQSHIGHDETWADLTSGSPFDEIAAGLFGQTTRGYALRRSMMYGKHKPLQFHQDGSFTGPEPAFNFWTPLQDCGDENSPGLEIVLRSGVPLFTLDDYADRPAVRAYIERVYGADAICTPRLRAGDVLVITSFTFHKTQEGAGSFKNRFSLELRGKVTDTSLAIANVPTDWTQIKTARLAEFAAT